MYSLDPKRNVLNMKYTKKTWWQKHPKFDALLGWIIVVSILGLVIYVSVVEPNFENMDSDINSEIYN